MFKNITGHNLGSYIHGRRLSECAVALRFTGHSILDIGMQYQFDSQQTFTRAFKKQFTKTPAAYCRSKEWSMTGIQPQICFDTSLIQQPEFVFLSPKKLIGITQSYNCNSEQISKSRTELRWYF